VFPAANPDAWRKRWVAAVQRAQTVVHAAPGHEPITVSPRIHDLRHTHAVLMLTEANMNLTALAARLGHSSPEITAAFYAHFGKSQVLSLGRVAANTTAAFIDAARPVAV
jgi:integrase